MKCRTRAKRKGPGGTILVVELEFAASDDGIQIISTLALRVFVYSLVDSAEGLGAVIVPLSHHSLSEACG